MATHKLSSKKKELYKINEEKNKNLPYLEALLKDQNETHIQVVEGFTTKWLEERKIKIEKLKY